MEEIKEKEYIRTDKGTIARIEDLEWDILYSVTEMKPKYKHWVSKEQCYIEYIVKHSFDIKDLVQAGDIILYNVNSKMTDIDMVKEHIDARTLEKTLRVGIWTLGEIEIKEILTKEQFYQMKYIVRDE